jgi:hypothetical protein
MRTGRPVAKIELSAEVAGVLEGYMQRRKTTQALAARARIVVGFGDCERVARDRDSPLAVPPEVASQTRRRVPCLFLLTPLRNRDAMGLARAAGHLVVDPAVGLPQPDLEWNRRRRAQPLNDQGVVAVAAAHPLRCRQSYSDKDRH